FARRFDALSKPVTTFQNPFIDHILKDFQAAPCSEITMPSVTLKVGGGQMSPQKQAAQIANAQKSHGPATEAGRARSSQNSIRHSLCSKKYFIVPEERPEFDIYYNDLIAALAPEGAAEALLAEKIILDEWRLTRAHLHENQIFFRVYMSSEQQVAAGAETWLANAKELATLTLYEQRINRVLTRNKAEFDSKQAARRGGGAGVLACGTPVPHPGAPPTQESRSAELAQALSLS